MDATHIHLLLNHFPILGTLFGMVILAVGIFSKKNSLVNTGLVMLVAMALLSIPLISTGEAAEDAIENLPGVDERYIEAHEELGETAVYIMVGLGILSLITLFVSIKGMAVARVLTIITLVASIGVFGLMAKVGNTGGEIRHPEIRASGVTQTDAGNPIQGKGQEAEEEKDDD